MTRKLSQEVVEIPSSEVLSVLKGANLATITVVRFTSFENFLNAQGLKWRYDPQYPLSKVNLDLSRRNAARPSLEGGIDEGKVETLKKRLSDPLDFMTWRPLAVVTKPKFRGLEGVWDLFAGGNHRGTAGHGCGLETVPAYVIDGSEIGDLTFRIIGVRHNAEEGTGNYVDELILMAVEETLALNARDSGTKAWRKKMMQKYGIPDKYGNDLTKEVSTAYMRRDIGRGGPLYVKGAALLFANEDGVLRDLHPVARKNQAICVKIIEAIVRKPALMRATKEIISLVQTGSHDDTERLAKIEAWESSLGKSAEVQDPKKRRAGQIERSCRAFNTTINRVFPESADVRDVILAEDRKKVEEVLRKAADTAREALNRITGGK